MEDVMNPRVFVMDTETTGIDEPIGVVEVAWLELDENCCVVPDSEKEYLVNPQLPISEDASGKHGIRDKDITDDLPILSEIEFPQDPMVFVAHNAKYDRKILGPYLNIVAELCTMRLGRRLLPDSPDHTLQTLGVFCDVPRQLAHRAPGDIKVTAGILKYMQEGSGLNIWQIIKWLQCRYLFDVWPIGKHRGTPSDELTLHYLKYMNRLDDLEQDLNDTVQYQLNKYKERALTNAKKKLTRRY